MAVFTLRPTLHSLQQDQLGDVRGGDVFRHWIFLDPRGREVHRYQLLSRGNPCRITEENIRNDYSSAGQWVNLRNNTADMPQAAVRVDGEGLIELTLEEALAALS
jgi:hypothetical protein